MRNLIKIAERIDNLRFQRVQDKKEQKKLKIPKCSSKWFYDYFLLVSFSNDYLLYRAQVMLFKLENAMIIRLKVGCLNI